jgi:predicted DNA-binding protein (MmcQ/YjbR family)
VAKRDEKDLGKAEAALRAHALAFPETREDHPWGESAFKVKGKTFVFLSRHEGGLHLSLKLPRSREFALEYPFTEPTGYGLGKAGWVSARFKPGDKVPLDVLLAWISESFEANAPKKLAERAKVTSPASASGRTAATGPKARSRAR